VKRRRFQRGGLYAGVMLVTLVVLILGLSALAAVRIRLRSVAGEQDAVAAGLYAQAGIERALLALYSDSAWRARYSNGTWNSPQAIGDGTFRFKLIDPLDGSLSDDPAEPARLFGEGQQGSALRLYSVELTQDPDLMPPNLITNGDMESGTADWTGFHCDLVSISSDPHSGAACLGAVNRWDSDGGAAQNVTSAISNGEPYVAEFWMRTRSGSATTTLALVVRFKAGFFTYYNYSTGGVVPIDSSGWTQVSATLTPSWGGTLVDAYLRAYTTSGTMDLLFDDASLREPGNLSGLAVTRGSWRREVNP